MFYCRLFLLCKQLNERVNVKADLVDFFSCYLILGKVAALNMLEKPTKIESVPFFWTVLLGKSIRYTGRVLTERI